MIDEIDRRIVNLLQEDARLSNAAIAEKVGLTSSSVYDRVKKLERKGVIKGYVAIVNPEMLNKPITAFIRISVGSGDNVLEPKRNVTMRGFRRRRRLLPKSDSHVEFKQSVTAACQAEPDVLECHGVAGEDSYMLKVRTTTPYELEQLIERIRRSAHVTRSITSIVLSTYKETQKIQPVGV